MLKALGSHLAKACAILEGARNHQTNTGNFPVDAAIIKEPTNKECKTGPANFYQGKEEDA